ncbi:MAG: hypothetical protein KF725_14350 [Cyclobacteriaceae bacterium]|nr:hypothetical protein [Cyclobacteriaceae bacterium]UYN87458.1 MAG: hypothetical protein KIT51_04105 [Cyclobacteriaceae bacterium]
MRIKLLLGLIALSGTLFAQTKIEQSIPVQASQKLELAFDYPELIKIQTWDRKEVMIKGEVSINKGENDDAFELITSIKNNVVLVTSELKDKDNLPKRIVIKRGEMEYVFKAKDYKDPEVKKFLEENGGNYTYMSSGIIREIKLEIFVPAGMETTVEAKYGIVEILGFNAPLKVTATYGGVDATINSRSTGELIARTHYGEILTNLDLPFDSSKDTDSGYNKWTQVSAKAGNGPRYTLESKYGKVYLRKP